MGKEHSASHFLSSVIFSRMSGLLGDIDVDPETKKPAP